MSGRDTRTFASECSWKCVPRCSQRHSVDCFVVKLFCEEITTMPATNDRPDLNLKTVVYATDFSFCSQNAGFYAARIAAYFSAKLLVRSEERRVGNKRKTPTTH